MPRALQNLDLDLIRTFAAIAHYASFTRAAEAIRRQQSTISLQMKRLETQLGCKLLERSPHAVTLTPEGETFLEHSRRLLDLNDEVVARVNEPTMRGRVRLGTPEDFATRHLHSVLARFSQAYPSVDLEVSCDLTLNLLDRFKRGGFDLALVKREREIADAGIRVWREPLVWVQGERDYRQTKEAIPLVVSPAPCVYRKRATEALDRSRRHWRVAYTCGSLAGSLAAVRAGLGVTVLPKEMVPSDLHIIDGKPLPDLKDTEIALLQKERLSHAAERLREHIVRCLSQAHGNI